MKGKAFIQWKNTDICMDFECPECGTSNHYDGHGAYFVKCNGCFAVFKCPERISLTKADEYNNEAIVYPSE